MPIILVMPTLNLLLSLVYSLPYTIPEVKLAANSVLTTPLEPTSSINTALSHTNSMELQDNTHHSGQLPDHDASWAIPAAWPGKGGTGDYARELAYQELGLTLIKPHQEENLPSAAELVNLLAEGQHNRVETARAIEEAMQLSEPERALLSREPQSIPMRRTVRHGNLMELGAEEPVGVAT